MSTLISQYMAKEQELKRLREELVALENDERLKKELEFKDKLVQLMDEFNMKTRDVLAFVDPAKGENEGPSTNAGKKRRTRKLRVYKNPNTGEVVETRGGNNKMLKEWKSTHGNETVESWLTSISD